ncbi:MAG: 50S ribosomal protein L18 [Bacteroidetes bacterium]|nr:50S ribosomal protein L18 [Bacteroidota bacterium]
MIMKKKNTRMRSKIKIRKHISGTLNIPRLTVYRSLTNIYAQLIDDSVGKTLASASSLSKEVSEELKGSKSKIARSKIVGNLLAKKALEKKISTIVFDRNGYKYHGRVQALADGAREGGLKF